MLSKNKPDRAVIRALIKTALAEDIGPGDITCAALVQPRDFCRATVVSKENNVVVGGLGIFREVFRAVDKNVRIEPIAKEGSLLRKPSLVCRISGPAKSILTAERTALNFLGRISGIATQARILSEKIKSSKAKLLDTRKTTPGMRALEKYAVRLGGGHNHRFGLFDQVLIKDNHISIFLRTHPGATPGDVVNAARKNTAGKYLIEIEIKNFSELISALAAKPDIIMLDNMTPRQMKRAVGLRNKLSPRVKLEASGNVCADNIRSVAASGIDYISVGALTHSVKNADYSLNFE